MFLKTVFLFVSWGLVLVSCEKFCYWNSQCPYQLFASKTPYDTVRGDVRDYTKTNCEAVSLWQLQRHGNRNPGDSVTADIKRIATFKDEIIASYNAGRSQLCAQDIEEFKEFTWNSTMEISASYLTGQGYEEIFHIASRIRQKFPELLSGPEKDYYFRPTKEQRTITSGMAFMHGLSESTNLTNLILNAPVEKQDIIRPYDDCENYQTKVKNGKDLKNQLDAYDNSAEYKAIRNKVQLRLGINTILSSEDVYSFFEICRFFRSWSKVKRSPWCSVFTDEDLITLEYKDDVRHYWRNGYGSWINVNLGGPVLKDLLHNFEDVVLGGGNKVTAYFTHDTMMEMAFCALGIYKDHYPILGGVRNADRIWRTSSISAFSTNIMAVLNKCQESSTDIYRVQILVNEKELDFCKPPGCTWEEFKTRFNKFNNSNLEFCNPNYIVPEDTPDSAALHCSILILIVLLQGVLFLR